MSLWERNETVPDIYNIIALADLFNISIDELINGEIAEKLKPSEAYFDIDKMIVKKNDEEVKLTSLELKILQLLFINIGKVVRRNTLLDKIWEITGNDVDDHTLTVYLKRIREKLGTDIIITIKGIGYRIDEK